MTNLITLTIPNDDHVALRAFGKALEEMALAHGAPLRVNPHVTVEKLREVMNNAEPTYIIPEVDTTSQQVESLSVPMGDNESPEEFLQRYDESTPVHDDEQAPPTGDSTGTPWDERIHSTSKALNADGTWRLRRKPKDMDEAGWIVFVDAVKDQLNGVPQSDEEDAEDSVNVEPTREEVDELIEASNEMLATIEPPVTPPGDDFHTDADVVTEETVASIPPIPVAPPVALPGSTGATDLLPPAPIPTAVTPVDTWDFPKLMKFLTERHGRITVEQVNALLAVDGLAALTDLNAHPDKIGPFVARVKAHLGE